MLSIHCFLSSVRAACGLLALARAVALSLADYLAIRLAASAIAGCEAVAARSSVILDSGMAGCSWLPFFGWRFFLRELSCPRLPPPFHGPVCLPVHASVRPLTLRSA